MRSFGLFLLVLLVGCRFDRVCREDDLSDVHRTRLYPDRVTPHPDLGTFEAPSHPDRPILAFYGGIGLRQDSNGTWTGYGIQDRADVDRLIRRCRAHGMNRIYASLLEQHPPSRLISVAPPDSVDLIPYAIDQAHANGIAVYADIPVFARMEIDQPFLDVHPGTLTRDRSGSPGRMFSPAFPEVRAYKRAIILEWLSRYPVDGIQLDFIRWPYEGDDLLHGCCEHGYDEPLLRELRRRHGLNDEYVPEPCDPGFLKIRREYVSLFIQELREALAASGIALPIGVYNSNAYGRRPSLCDVCQDWEHWERNRLVDEHHPMFVMDSLTRLVRATQSLMEIKRPESAVFGPIFLSGGFRPTPEMCREAARRLIKLGCDGIWFCRSSEIEAFELWPVVQEISRYSLSEIRAQDFDPLAVNLLANGDFERGMTGWRTEPVAETGVAIDRNHAASGRASLKVDLAVDHPITIFEAEPRSFLAHLPYAVRSLGVSFSYRMDTLSADVSPRLLVNLTYSNDDREVRTSTVPSTQLEWRPVSTDFPVAREPAKLLSSATVQIWIPPGRGTIWLDSFEMVYDPLDNPLDRPTVTR